MAVMTQDPFQTDPVLQRAAGYPYDITETSFTFVGGAAAPFDPTLTEGRYPVIGYGSNQSPQRLRQKYGTDHSPIPVQRGRLADHDVVYSAHFSSYGSLPAALRQVDGTAVSVAVNWLDDAQLPLSSICLPGRLSRRPIPSSLVTICRTNSFLLVRK